MHWINEKFNWVDLKFLVSLKYYLILRGNHIKQIDYLIQSLSNLANLTIINLFFE